ncbi:hypothetical protein [Nocardiopsis metallicus]|uniref:Uncharacterized protein n=1 Tax=Nocardiopsis metallicus TaxID=179819 RepID=A0A840VYN5_9ACTN|nr:hypothetical protein [Nocardiopsis metallicus]MBB5489549.1 hypothetical protein [Nocardiopsis metallicus]
MKLEDISKEALSTTRRVLAGGAIAAAAVFGVAACEDTGVDPGVEDPAEPGMENGIDDGLDDGMDGEGDE